MRKTLFNANFYESRRLRHDALIEYMVRDTNSRGLYTEYFSVARKPKPLLKESIFLPIELADMVHFPNFKLLSPSSLYDLISLYIPSLLRHKVNQQGQEVDNQKGAFYIKKIIFILSF